MDRQHDWRPSSRPRRRRLRREVRMAGCALLAFLPLVCMCTLGWQSLSSQLLAASVLEATASPQIRHAAQDRRDQARLDNSPAAVVLSIEPAIVAPESETEVPVVFPGYVLPDDSLEESSHAGS